MPREYSLIGPLRARRGVAKGNAFMKTMKLVLVIVAIAVALFLIVPSLSWAADDGAALYKAKCAAQPGVR